MARQVQLYVRRVLNTPAFWLRSLASRAQGLRVLGSRAMRFAGSLGRHDWQDWRAALHQLASWRPSLRALAHRAALSGSQRNIFAVALSLLMVCVLLTSSVSAALLSGQPIAPGVGISTSQSQANGATDSTRPGTSPATPSRSASHTPTPSKSPAGATPPHTATPTSTPAAKGHVTPRTARAAPAMAAQSGILTAVAVVSSDDVWAVGGDGQPLIEHWDGSAWNVVLSPHPGAFGLLTAVAAVSADDVWAVGFASNGTSIQPLIEHWDGEAWSIVPSPDPGTDDYGLASVAAVSVFDVWAVGGTLGEGEGDPTQPLIEHWDGGAWSIVPSPNLTTVNNGFSSVTAVAADDVWAVGSDAQAPEGDEAFPSEPLIEHWDGSAWNVVPSPTFTDGGGLGGVAAVAADDVWAVGSASNGDSSQTLIEQWDGGSWNVVTSPNLNSNNTDNLSGVVALSSSDVWAVGDDYDFTNQVDSTLIEHWDGGAWSIAPSPSPGTGSYLDGVAAAADDDVWAVGATSSQPLIEHWDGSEWSVPGFPLQLPAQGATGTEREGDGNPSELDDYVSCACDPIDTYSGNFAHTFDDLETPGRGIPLDFTRTYNAASATVSGPTRLRLD